MLLLRFYDNKNVKQGFSMGACAIQYCALLSWYNMRAASVTSLRVASKDVFCSFNECESQLMYID